MHEDLLATVEDLKQREVYLVNKNKSTEFHLREAQAENKTLILSTDELTEKLFREITYYQEMMEEGHLLTEDLRRSVRDLKQQLETRQEDQILGCNLHDECLAAEPQENTAEPLWLRFGRLLRLRCASVCESVLDCLRVPTRGRSGQTAQFLSLFSLLTILLYKLKIRK